MQVLLRVSYLFKIRKPLSLLNWEGRISIKTNRYNLPTVMNANVRSINNKIDDLYSVAAIKNVDIACLTETWLKEEVPNELIHIPDFNIFSNDRAHKRGGGVAIYVKDSIPVSLWPDLLHPDFETLWLTLRPLKMPRMFSHVSIGVVYHPPGANNWELSKHLAHCMDTILQKHPSTGLLLMGDMNHFKGRSIKSS